MPGANTFYRWSYSAAVWPHIKQVLGGWLGHRYGAWGEARPGRPIIWE